MDLDEFRPALDSWLDEHADVLAPEHSGRATLDDQMAQLSKVKRLAYDAGWMRWGGRPTSEAMEDRACSGRTWAKP